MIMINQEEFISRIQKIMDYYGMTASAFAERIQFNKSGISHLLSGRNKPSLEFIMKVLDAFPEVSLYWLLNGKGHFPKEENPITPESPSSTPSTTSPLPENKIVVSSNEEIERIVIFYKNGQFKNYFPDI
jgi:transcriptional regulator with XRE-family HTH domain